MHAVALSADIFDVNRKFTCLFFEMAVKWLSHKSGTPPLMPLNLRSLIIMCSARQEVANITFTWCCPFMRNAFMWYCAGRHECTNTITGVIPSCLHSTSYTQMPLNLRSLIILCSARQEVANTKLHLVLPFRARCLHVVLRRAAQVHKYMFKRVGLRISTR